MTHLKLKMLLCLIVCLLFLGGPFLLDFAPGGKAYASGSGSKRGDQKPQFVTKSKAGPENFGYKITKKKNNGEPPAPVPEPATLLLFGAGAVGLAAFKKKIKKK